MPNEIRDISFKDTTNFDYIFEQNVTIPLKSTEGVVRCNVYRPKSQEQVRVPVLMTYGPYGLVQDTKITLTAVNHGIERIYPTPTFIPNLSQR